MEQRKATHSENTTHGANWKAKRFISRHETPSLTLPAREGTKRLVGGTGLLLKAKHLKSATSKRRVGL